MTDGLPTLIREELRTLAVARRYFPTWFGAGWSDDSCNLHSVGVSFWTTFGQHSGFEAVSEMPAPPLGPFAFAGSDVRSDSAWSQPASWKPRLLVEFERYAGEVDALKLRGKMQNLVLAQHRWGSTAELLILAYWTRGLASLPDHENLRRIARHGFETSERQRVDGIRSGDVLFVQFVHEPSAANHWRLQQTIERGVL
ncbi:hypothetical protein CfE428DRAFT_1275 [Chthoniobacter flavus Ellin428]|uniref:Uncharacterized protein n=1 Tax=Chthoniobacter flavus Ellin428 TaxID=497964 RepID=B4CXI4_9BACT|nr:hypothetical protein [Chthoniobacter flavus]EDY20982.1 hypothetical protein CfE428DRAFT_1275 [Chthoniobacter flavus Ellin428]TCO88710.1 hypothetical protein EV701_11682 [Chthoniobacter flavus]